MGAAESKPDSYSWKTSGPPSISSSVIESLQLSPETDASRERLMERHIQARVGEELRRARTKESEALRLAQERIAEAAVARGEDGGPSRHTLGREIDELRVKLEQRKKIQDLPAGVEEARAKVVRCLRENDRRPLDCYDEVQAFKGEVKKLERDWVNKVTA